MKFSTENPQNVIASYDEGACIYHKGQPDADAGTICFKSVGNTCSKVTDCVPVGDAISSGKFTKEEIDKKIELVEKAYGLKYIY